MPERLQKYLARCGVGSRRHCEELMEQGRVTVDGEIIREPGFQVDADRQTVCFNGKEIHPEKNVYYALHKPPGYVCTSHDPQGRPLAIDLLPSDVGRVYTVGRLDAVSEGLIIVTNDGSFAHRLSHPRYEVTKTYELSLARPLSVSDQKQWKQGIDWEGETLRVLTIRHMNTGKSGATYRVTLGEGRNRHLRRMAEFSDVRVLRLKRVSIGSLSIGDLKRGEFRVLTEKDVSRLMNPVSA